MARATTNKIKSLPVTPVGKVVNPRSWCIYGRSGTGKTTLSSSFPKPILLLDFGDRGTDSIKDVKDIDVMFCEVPEDLDDAYYFLVDNPKKYKTIVIDTVTEMQSMVMKEVMSKKKKKMEGKNLGDWGTMTKREWGEVAGIMKNWIDDFKELPMNVVFLAQDRVSRDDDEEDSDNTLLPEVGPRLMPSVASTLNAAVSIIGNTFTRVKRIKKEVKGRKTTVEKVVYCLRVGPNPIYTTKIRKPRSTEAPAYLEDPVYEDVMDIVEGVA